MKLENVIEPMHNKYTVVSARVDAGLAAEFRILQGKLSEEGLNLRLTVVVEEAMRELLEQSN